jgi:general secretion pathway protein L
VAAVAEARLSAWTDALARLGLTADALVPDSLVPAEPEEADIVNAITFGPTVALRGQRLAVSVQPDLAPVIAGERRLVPIESDAGLEARLIAIALAPPVDLGGSERRATAGEGWKAWRLAGALALALLVSPLVLTAAAAIRDDTEASRMRDDAATRARVLFPDMATDADPLAEAERRLALTPPPGGVAVVAAVLFQALEGVPGAELDSLTADPVSGVRATVSYTAFQDLEAIRSGVEALGLSMVEEATLEEGDRIASDIIVGVGA